MRILIVEDDTKLCDLLAEYLTKEGYAVECCYHGDEALLYIEQCPYDLLLLDRMLPGMDGLSILREVRRKKNNIHIIMITALGQLNDKLEGLDSGADDYLVKPFAPEELLARIRCINRRPSSWEDTQTRTVSDLILHVQEMTLDGPNGSCSLSKRECALLEVLLQNVGHTLQRNTIIAKVWGTDSDIEDGNLDNYVFFLRRRLKSLDSQVSINTIRGIGYKLTI